MSTRGVAGGEPTSRNATLGRRIALALAVAASLATGVIAVVPSPALAAPEKCPDILLLGARGSGERASAVGGLGPTVGKLAGQIEERLDTDAVSRLAVAYEAAGVETLVPSRAQAGLFARSIFGPASPELKARRAAAVAASFKIQRLGGYTASIDEGVRGAQEQLTTFQAKCPDTSYILAGFSQGAMVMHQTLLRLADAGDDDTLGKIIATVLIADGDRVKDTTATQVGSAPSAARGVRSVFSVNERDSKPEPDMVVYDVCVEGDLVCDFSLLRIVRPSASQTMAAVNRSATIHTSTYKDRNNPLLAEVADAIARQEGRRD